MTPIYVQEVVNVSYDDIFNDVCMRLDNDLEPHSKTFTGDGVTKIFHLPHRGICATPVPTGLGDGVLDKQSGYITYAEAPAAADFTVEYCTRHWPEVLLWRLVNNGLHYLYPKFYAVEELRPEKGSDGDYELADEGHPFTTLDQRSIGAVIDAEILSSSGTIHLSPHRDYRIIRKDSESCFLRLFNTGEGTLVVRVAMHPVEFGQTTTTLAEIGLPNRAREPLVLYTCWQATTQKMPARMRGDNLSAIALEGKTTFFDHIRAVQAWKMLLDAELQANHMRSWVTRGL